MAGHLKGQIGEAYPGWQPGLSTTGGDDDFARMMQRFKGTRDTVGGHAGPQVAAAAASAPFAYAPPGQQASPMGGYAPQAPWPGAGYGQMPWRPPLPGQQFGYGMPAAGPLGWPAAPPPPPGWPSALHAQFAAPPRSDMMTAMMLETMGRLAEGEEARAGLGTTGQSLRRLHKMHGKVEQQPDAVLQEYWSEMLRHVGAEPGDPFKPWHFSERLSWGRFKGYQRLHWHMSHVLDLLAHGHHQIGTAYLVQVLRATHQVALDQGGWEVASLLLPRQDPQDRVRFGGTPAELETISAYRDALKKISKKEDGEKGAKGAGKKKDDDGQ